MIAKNTEPRFRGAPCRNRQAAACLSGKGVEQLSNLM